MIALKSLITEIPEKLVTYHRSLKTFKPGEVLSAQKMGETGRHHYQEDWFEIAMEAYRKRYAPDKPSRMNCVFSSFIPRSRFVDRGYLYLVRPQGKILITDSLLIDNNRRRFEDSFYGSSGYEEFSKAKKRPWDVSAEEAEHLSYDLPYAGTYWDGMPPSQQNLQSAEVLSDTALVINQLAEDPRRLKVREVVEVTESDKIPAKLDLYFVYDTNQDDKGKDTHYHTAEEMDKVADGLVKHLFSSVKSSKGEDSTWGKPENKLRFHHTIGFLRKGVQLKIGYVQSKLMYKHYDDSDRGKYSMMSFGFFYNGKWFEKGEHKRLNPSFSLEYYPYDASMNVRDIGKYLRRV
jgi:hypothetical protein